MGQLTIDRSILTRIREAVNLPVLVQEYVTMRRSGQQHLILCPSHEEKNPSCRVYPDHAYCFTCQWHGDAYRFLMLVTGCTFMEAATQLSERTGIPLTGTPTTRIQRAYDAEAAKFTEWWWRRQCAWLALRLSAEVLAGEDAGVMLVGVGHGSYVISDMATSAGAAGAAWRSMAGLRGEERRRRCLMDATEADREEWRAAVAEDREFAEAWISLGRSAA